MYMHGLRRWGNQGMTVDSVVRCVQVSLCAAVEHMGSPRAKLRLDKMYHMWYHFPASYKYMKS